MSSYKFYVLETKKLMLSIEARFDELVFPYRTESIIMQDKEDHLTNILRRVPSGATWVAYDKSLPPNSYQVVHHDSASDVVILRLVNETDTYTKTTQYQRFEDLLARQVAFIASIRSIQGISDDIDTNKPPTSYKDAMSRSDAQEWAEAHYKEYKGFKDRNAFATVVLPEGAKVLGTTTRWDYKVDNGVFSKRKVRMCVRGDQQRDGVDYQSADLYSPTLKATEARLLTAIAAEHGCKIYKTDTSQAFLYGDMADDKVYINPPKWWPEIIPDGHVLQLLKSIYGTKQAARRWHIHISEWMEKNGYPAVNNEKTIFMKRVGNDFIIHGLFVDDMMHVPTNNALRQEFMDKYSKDFDITGGSIMESFLGMEVEQSRNAIRLHLDKYVHDIVSEYETYADKPVRLKLVPSQPGLMLTRDDCPMVPDPTQQRKYRSVIAKLQFAATWIRFDISFSVAQLARFCASAGPSHWQALHRLIGYLKQNPSFKLTYRKRSSSSNGLIGFADSDWANSLSRHSTTGNLFLYNGTPIAWRSKLQKTIALSTAEAEYYSASRAAVEVIYLRYLLSSMGFSPEGYTPVYEDNNACIEWGNNIIGGRERAKHIDIRKHFAHEAIRLGHLRLIRISTSNQLADIFTKSIHSDQWATCIASILGGRWTPS